jgi:hypothetical protein
MGATIFQTYVSASRIACPVDIAFSHAQQSAKHYYGHGGYTGTIAEKDSYCLIDADGIPYDKATKLADELIRNEDSRINDKWGPAGVIRIQQRGSKNRSRMVGWLFFGWASE